MDATRVSDHAARWPTLQLRAIRLFPVPGSGLEETLEKEPGVPSTRILAAGRPIARIEGDAAGLLRPACPYVLCIFPLPDERRGLLYLDSVRSRRVIAPADVRAMNLEGFLGKTVRTTFRMERDALVRRALLNFIARGADSSHSEHPTDRAVLEALQEALAAFGPACGGIYESEDSVSWKLIRDLPPGVLVPSAQQLKLPSFAREEVSTFLNQENLPARADESPSAIFCRLLAASAGTRYGVYLGTREPLAGSHDVHALESLCGFGSALLAMIEGKRRRSKELKEFIENGTAKFPVRVLPLMGHEVCNVLQNALSCIITIRNEQQRRLTPKDRRQLEAAEARLTAALEALDGHLSFLKEDNSPDVSNEEWSEPFSVAFTVQRMLAARLVAFGRRVEDVISLEGLTRGVAVRMNKTSLTIVIYNLLENAIKATSQTPNPRIRVAGDFDETTGDVFCLRVIDNGIGIRADERALVFTGKYPGFAKRRLGSRDGNRGASGAGAGLFAVKALVEGANGQITADHFSATIETVFLVRLRGRKTP